MISFYSDEFASQYFALREQLKNTKDVASLVMEDFKSIGLAPYEVIIHLDELSKKEVLSFTDQVNFNTKMYLEYDYENFKEYISSSDYPRHVDLWSKYRKEQVQQLLSNNPKDIMKGTRIEDDVMYAYVTVVKSDGTK